VTYEQGIAYDRKELAQILKAFKAMDDEATKTAQEVGFEFSKWIFGEIKEAGYTRYINPAAVRRIVDGGSVSKTSKIGEIKYGFARQRFSGGGTTRQLWAGFEFGSKKFKQFPAYSGRFGKGGRGWFIYPTLRKNQPELIRRWNEKFDKILDHWKKGV
jgi:hypothetical protein